MAKKLSEITKKRILPAVLALAMLLSLCPAIDFSSFALTSGDGLWEYTVSGTDAAITKYNGSATEVTIPEKIDGYIVTRIYGIYADYSYTAVFGKNVTSVTIPDSVTSIDISAFEGCTGLTSINVDANNQNYSSLEGVLYNKNKTEIIYYPIGKTDKSFTIPNSVTSINNRAFDYCWGLTSIAIPNSVTNIGSNAFRGCTGLTSITIPNSVTKIGWGAFRYCTGLTSITIPDSVTKIDDEAFAYCTELTSITIPNSVTSIGDYAFDGCAGLTSITISSSVTSIDSRAFSNCTGLESITVDENNPNYSSVDGILYNKAKTEFILVPKKIKGSITIPNSITSIYEGAFAHCTGLTSVTIGNSVTSIDDDAFKGCDGLTSIEIPNSVTSIGNGAFAYCTGLTSVTIGNSVTSIGSRAFYDCTGLTSVTIGNSVTSIGSRAFYDCTGLTSVTIPNSVTSIGDSAFSGFGLDRVTILGDSNPYGNIFGNVIIYWNGGSNDYRFSYDANDDGTATITNYKGNTTELTIPNTIDGYTVTSIDDIAFYNRKGLTSVTIPDSVMSIGERAFYDCTGLTSVTIPSSVESIGDNAFSGCTGLESITVDENNPNYSSVDDILYNKDKTKLIDCPQSKKGSVTIPSSVTSIDSWAFSGCTGLESITVDENNPNYSSLDGVLYNKDKTELIDCPQSKKGSVMIPSFVSSIGSNAFHGCTGLTNITIPNSVTSIGNDAFSYCTGLESIMVDENNQNYSSVDSILYNKDKTRIVVVPLGIKGSVTIPNSVTSIGDSAFRDCTGLTSVAIPNSVTRIGNSAFGSCTGLTSITIPNSVANIGYWAFYNCTGLTSITIPSSVMSMDSSAFDGCTGLENIMVDENNPNYSSVDGILYNKVKTEFILIPKKIKGSVTIPNSVTSIGDKSFYYCTELTSITIPNSVTSIDDWAFSGCTNLKTVYLNKSSNPYGNIFGNAEIIFVPNKIEVTAMPSKTVYAVGETFDKTGIAITVSYDDGKSKTVTDYILSGFDSATVGEKTVTVTYGGKSTAFTLLVKAPLTDITVTPGKVLYAVGETIDKADITVTANYDDGSSDTLSAEYYTITAPDMSSIGNKTVMVSCNGKTAYFTVKVRNAFTQKDNFENKGTVDTSVGIISANAFDDTITEITIGDNVQQIADDAFTFTSGKPVIIRGYKNSAVQKFAEKMGTDKVQFEELAQPKKGLIVNPLNPDPAAQPEMRDALAMFKGIVYDETDTFFCKAAADMDDSGDINLVDCLALLLKLKNSPPKTEPEQTA